MLTHNEISRLAAMANTLRPDWPVNSLTTFLAKHRNRTYRDVAVALAWVCADPDTTTPARLNEAGPWWKAVTAGDGSVRRGDSTMRCPEHGEPYTSCGQCKNGEFKKMPDTARQALAEAIEAGKSAIPFRERKPYSPKGAKKS